MSLFSKSRVNTCGTSYFLKIATPIHPMPHVLLTTNDTGHSCIKHWGPPSLPWTWVDHCNCLNQKNTVEVICMTSEARSEEARPPSLSLSLSLNTELHSTQSFFSVSSLWALCTWRSWGRLFGQLSLSPFTTHCICTETKSENISLLNKFFSLACSLSQKPHSRPFWFWINQNRDYLPAWSLP